jgi:hypothetical protein
MYDSESTEFGGSSFPLLPHSSLFDADVYGMDSVAPPSVGGSGQERAFVSSGRVHAQHLSSVMNAPSTALRQSATRAVSGAASYLPTLASVWTFTTGVEPPSAVHRVSNDLALLVDEGAQQPGPFILPPCPFLDSPEANDMSVVREHMRTSVRLMRQYRHNHPRAAARAAAARAAHVKQRGGRAGNTTLVRTAPRPHLNGTARVGGGGAATLAGFDASLTANDEDDDDVWGATSSRRGDVAPPVRSGASPADGMQSSVRECYEVVPTEFFQPDFHMGQLAFWRDQRDLEFINLVCDDAR